jgi:hypothetical protein
MGDVTGLRFLDKIFYITDGIMLSGIREISGIDGSTLQNWTKRGWVGNSKHKRYNIDQVAHILIINMLRSCMLLENIAFLIKYINGRVDDESDNIIRYETLYNLLGNPSERQAKAAIRSNTVKLLDNYVKMNYIAGYSQFKHGAVIVGVKIQLNPGDRATIDAEAEEDV